MSLRCTSESFSADIRQVEKILSESADQACNSTFFLGNYDDFIRRYACDYFEDDSKIKEGSHAIVIRHGELVYKILSKEECQSDTLLHYNELFSDSTPYVFVGIIKKDDEFSIVVSQRYVRRCIGSGEQARLMLLADLDLRFGDARRLTTDTRDEIVAGSWYIDDLKDDNVGIDKESGRYFVLDCIIHKAETFLPYSDEVKSKGRSIADFVQNENIITIESACTHSEVARRFQTHYAGMDCGVMYGSYLYHYTSPEVFEILMKDESDLLCTHYKDLNDSTEFQLGIDATLAYMEDKGWNTKLRRRIEALLNVCCEKDLFVPWIASFSRLNDSLYQWISYTDPTKGGYAIGFEVEELKSFCSKSTKASKVVGIERSAFCHQCCYVGVDEYYDAMNQVFGSLNGLDIHSDSNDVSVVSQVVNWCLAIAAIFKHKGFFNEDEFRLIVQADSNQTLFGDEILEIKKKKRIKSGLKNYFGSLKSIIRHVVISPHGDTDDLESMAKSLCGGSGIKIFRSTIPYKGKIS